MDRDYRRILNPRKWYDAGMNEAAPKQPHLSQESGPSFPGINETFPTGILFNLLLNEIGVGPKNAIAIDQLQKRLWKNHSREFAAQQVKSLKSVLEKNKENLYELVITSQKFYLHNKNDASASS